MNNILTEKEFQKYIIERLEKDNGYVIRDSKCYDSRFACDPKLLIRFLDDTQPDTMEYLRGVYKNDTEETVINFINSEITKPRGGLLNVLKHGVEIANKPLTLMYTKSAKLGANKESEELYAQNIFSVSEEVWASDKERIDLVIFLNGLAIMSFELKCNLSGQSYKDAIEQYRTQRNPQTRLFYNKPLCNAGCLVNFAMDLYEVYMTTRIEGDKTYFLPFNMGCGEGVNAGKGNPIFEDKYSVSYMWEDILKKDTIIELIKKFIFTSVKDETDEATGKKKPAKENVIFPRFHQLDVIRKLLADIYVNKSSQNYLIQHSAGSGKTNSIAWLAHRLVSMYGDDGKIVFDNIVIVTDRVVVDRQLQAAVMSMEHKSGVIRVMDDKCTSTDLKRALEGNTKIVATTIQKFPHIVSSVKGLKNKRFAVIIDEAHSSTSGKNMAAVSKALAADGEDYADAEDMISSEIRHSGKQDNVSMFAFTATPKPTTIQLFGRINTKGQREAFHIYSMKQAIEENFILDVLQNYVCYKTFYKINKEIAEDPRCKTNDAKRQIARFVELHDTNIAQRIEVIIEHFRLNVMSELDYTAKAMVVTASREAAVKYRKAFEEYINRKGYRDIHALVAFSGKVYLKDDPSEYTEPIMNGFSEERLTSEFDTDDYQVLLVANKFQTGFDQPKLCAMYIMKKLSGVNAVQTLSRLNRICPPYEKKTFILDFVNSYEEIEGAFSTYYTTTLLVNSITPSGIYDKEAEIDAYDVLDVDDIDRLNEILYNAKDNNRLSDSDKTKILRYLEKAKRRISKYEDSEQREILVKMRGFCRFYEFLIQVSCFEDIAIHKKYIFITKLLSLFSIRQPGGGFNLDGKITATDFVQKKDKEIKKSRVISSPLVSLPTAAAFGITEEKIEQLSKIIADINSRMGKPLDIDVTVKSILQIKDIMLKSETLKKSAKNNTEKDFELAYYGNIDDALIEGLSQNQDFFSMLLNQDDIKRQVMGIFAEEVYRNLRDDV